MHVAFIRPLIRVRDIELAEHLAELGIQVHVISNHAIDLDLSSMPRNVKVLTTGGTGLHGLMRLINATKSVKPKVTLCVFSSFMLPYTRLLGMRIGAPVIHYVNAHPRTWHDLKHGFLTYREVAGLCRAPLALVETLASFPVVARLLLRSANSPYVSRLVVPSQKLHDEIVEYGIERHKIRVIPWGIDTVTFTTASARTSVGLRFDRRASRVVLYYGYATISRGAGLMLEAFERVAKHNGALKLIMLLYVDADSRECRYLKRMVLARGLASKTELVFGYKSRGEICSLLGRVGLVVLPFKYSGSVIEAPLSLMEAMSLGRRIVTTDVNAVSEVLSDYKGSKVVRPNDPAVLAGAIEEMLNSKERGGELPSEYELRSTARRLKVVIDEVSG